MLKIDLHLHTIASRHAHNTILEYINQAKKLKMKVIGISDHGPGNGGSLVNRTFLNCLSRIPRVVNGIRVLKGVEADVVTNNGEIDVDDEMVNKLDFVIANIHENAIYSDQGKKKNTETMIKAIKLGKIDIISHPFWTRIFDYDMKKTSEEACKNNVLLEIDLHYLAQAPKWPFVIPNLKTMIEVVKKYKKKVIVNSDAHNIWELADDSILKKYKKEIGLTDDMIINNYPKELFKLLKIDE